MSEVWLYPLGAINLLTGLYSLRESLRYLHYVRSAVKSTRSPFLRSVALLVPCCGAEGGLEENLVALGSQDYPELTLIFILERELDPAGPVIDRVTARLARPAVKVVAGPAEGRGQKVHNLLAGLRHAADQKVLAFADSDGRPDPGWLARLVEPLARQEVGVASGYRFYLPEPGCLASLVRSVWNTGVLTLLGEHDRNFAWGGSMAIRREVFERAGVEKAWQGALSDDYALTHAVRRAGYRVEFVPTCLVASTGKVSWSELLNWCARQMAVTRIYWPNLWRITGGSQVLYVGFLIAGAFVAAAGDAVTAALLGAVLGLTFLSSGLRFRAVRQLVSEWSARLRSYGWAYLLLVPLASLLTVYAFARSGLSRRIEWRGKIYEMRSPTETVVLSPSGRL